jgi:transposase
MTQPEVIPEGQPLFPSGKLRIFVSTCPIDFRKGHDGLIAVVQHELGRDPFDGTVFVFRAKRGDRVKIVFWDGTGLVMTYKRLEGGNFVWPAVRSGIMRFSKGQFEALFEGLDWRRLHAVPDQRPVVSG